MSSVLGEVGFPGVKLYTWQYSATAALIVEYSYTDTNHDTIRLNIFKAGRDWTKEPYYTSYRVSQLKISLQDYSTSTNLPYEYLSNSINYLKFYSVNKVAYVCHPLFRPKKITYDEDNATCTMEEISIEIDPVLDEYADRNKFFIDKMNNQDTPDGHVYQKGDFCIVYEKPLTQALINKGVEEFCYKNKVDWRSLGWQMLMLKFPTEMTKTWGLLYDSSTTDNDGHLAINPIPEPSETYQNEYGGRNAEVDPDTAEWVSNENTDYRNTVSKCDWCSEWICVSGSISIETAGKWSGKLVIDLWKPSMSYKYSTESSVDGVVPLEWDCIAVIDVHNAMSNKSITRDIADVGSMIRIRCVRRERAQAVSCTYDGSSSSYKVIYMSQDNDTGCYITLSYAQDIPIYLRCEKYIENEITFADTGDTYTLKGYECSVIAPFKVNLAYKDTGILSDFSNVPASSSFAEGAWCGYNYGYPFSCGVFQERMVYGGNYNKPCTLWLSNTNEWTNFIQGTDSTSPIFGTANTDSIDSIMWLLITKSYIMFGSGSGEWYFGASDGGSLKPSNYSFQRLSNYGSTRGLDAVLFGNSTIVAKNGATEVVDVSYNTLSEQGSGVNLSLYSEHLFEGAKISAMCATCSPILILWVLTSDGVLCSFTYEQNNNVFAWARHTVLGGIKSMCSFREDERDKLCVVVSDNDGYYILGELDPNRGLDYDKDDLDDRRYGRAVFQDNDGTYYQDYYTSNGVQRSNGYICNGVNYESRVIPTPIRAPNQDGMVYGQKVAFKNFDIYLKTHNGDFDGSVWADGTEFTVKLGSENSITKEFVCDNGWLETNEKKVFGENRIKLPLTTGWDDYALVDISTTYPAPLTITAIGADFAVSK